MLPLAAGAAVSPTLLALQLLTMSQRVAPLRRAWAVAAGAAAVLLVDTGLALVLAAGTGQTESPSRSAAVVKLAIAVALVALGIRGLRSPPRSPGPGMPTGLRRSFLLGAALMLTNVTTLALYFPAVHEAAASGVAALAAAVVVAVVFVVTLAPALVPPVSAALIGAPARRALQSLGELMTRHRRALSAGVPLVFACYLTALALPVLI